MSGGRSPCPRPTPARSASQSPSRGMSGSPRCRPTRSVTFIPTAPSPRSRRDLPAGCHR
ncbi:hypothetical protein ACFFX0_08490 [Citricoccus parietis]|uniref:Uncharacterized protein n=1 Tax=Citricoccus parietis TaxID=592307 RepID=A0ABV5FX73_9MICC